MPFCHQTVIAWPCTADFCPAEDPGSWILAEAPAASRPRHPERTGFYQLFETHFDSYVRAYEERFEARSGPLRPVIVRSVEAFLDCGRLQGRFAASNKRPPVNRPLDRPATPLLSHARSGE